MPPFKVPMAPNKPTLQPAVVSSSSIRPQTIQTAPPTGAIPKTASNVTGHPKVSAMSFHRNTAEHLSLGKD